MNKYDKETNLNNEPNTTINTQKTFNLRANMEIPAYSEPDKYVPEIDKNYKKVMEREKKSMFNLLWLKKTFLNNQ